MAFKHRWKLRVFRGFGLLNLAESCVGLRPVTMPGIYKVLDGITADFDGIREVVITFAMGESKATITTKIRLDIPDSESVRVTSLLCLLGVGLGVGSLLLYKLISTLFPSDDGNEDKNTSPRVDFDIDPVHEHHRAPRRSPQSPSDSGVSCDSGMGNVASTENSDNLGAYYFGPQDKVRFRGFHQSPTTPADEEPKIVTTPSRQNFAADTSSGSFESGGFDVCGSNAIELESFSHLESDDKFLDSFNSAELHLDIPTGYFGASELKTPDSAQVSLFGNFSPGSLNERIERVLEFHEQNVVQDDHQEVDSVFTESPSPAMTLSDESNMDNHQNFCSGSEWSFGDSSIGFSTPGMLSNIASDVSVENSPERMVRERLKRHARESFDRASVDLDSDLFDKADVGLKTKISMEEIEKELVTISHDMNEMNHRLKKLSSEKVPISTLEASEYAKPHELQHALQVIRRYKKPGSFPRSRSISEEKEVSSTSSESSPKFSKARSRRSYHHSEEYFWDYSESTCDLTTSHSTIVGKPALPPLQLPSTSAHIGPTLLEEEIMEPEDLPSLSEIKAYFEMNAGVKLQQAAAAMQKAAHEIDRLTPDLKHMHLAQSMEASTSGIDTDSESHVSRSRQDSETTGLDVEQLSQISSQGINVSAFKNIQPEVKSCNKEETHSNIIDNNLDSHTSEKGPGDGPSNTKNISDTIKMKPCDKLKLTDIRGNDGLCQCDKTSDQYVHNKDRSHTDSGGCAACQVCRLPEYSSAGKKLDTLHYAHREWKGKTIAAAMIRQGYEYVSGVLQLKHLRRIRGDHYCAIRATLFQVLAQGIPVLDHVGKLPSVLQKLKLSQGGQYKYLQKYSFGGRLAGHQDISQSVQRCIKSLYRQVLSICKYKKHELEDFACEVLNTSEDQDIELMEAMKLLMLVNAVRLYEDWLTGQDVPSFICLMYARDSSTDPQSFLLNHLNCIGHSAGLEQVELILLASTLGITIKVLRLSQYGQIDFTAEFTDESQTGQHTITLLSEDDRHYNVPLL